MQVYTETGNLPVFTKAVVTIGTFDGVHSGHRQIIAQLKEEARLINGETVIVTFHPHPRRIVGDASRHVQLLSTIEEKTALLAETGVDHLVICPFTESFSQLTAPQYITEFLLQKFSPHTIVIGYDHKFGNGRTGDYKLLEQYSITHKFRLTEIPAHLINESSVSSTRIREALLKGEAGIAARLLGYNYFFRGKVITGNQLGRTIGFPTANLDILNPEKLVPGNGVYAVMARLENQPDHGAFNASLFSQSSPGQLLKGMMNIGMRPTVSAGETRSVEVNLFDFSNDIYGSNLTIFVQEQIRPEQKFAGLDALKLQIGKDRENAIRILSRTD